MIINENRYSFHFSALFSAVEHGRLDKARTILESTDVDVNRCENRKKKENFLGVIFFSI